MAAKGETTTSKPHNSTWTNRTSEWKSKWFVLESQRSEILCYKSKEKLQKGITAESISLKQAVVMADEESELSFTVNSEGKLFKFETQDNKERQKWIHAIDSAIHYQKGENDIKSVVTSNGAGYTPIKLISELKSNVGNTEVVDGPDKEEFFDAISTPLISFTTTDSSSLSDLSYSPSPIPKDSLLLTTSNPVPPRRANSTMSIAKGVHGKEQRRASVLSDTASFVEEEIVLTHITTVAVRSRLQSPDVIDDDYEEEKDLAETVNDHKSIILHVLSQLRPGVDLTRITLPAFILERRSNLEVTADMFGHADYLARIPLYPDPKRRMIEAVRFFVSTISSGRKGTLAKKPYNPILGELFRCYYDFPEDVIPVKETSSAEEDIVKQGPVPWSNYSSVTFLTEQVSHHPPISAFYAECPATGIYATGYAQVKSRFLGLSVQVQNIGLITVNIPRYNEEYRVHLPNAYGRSILTVPWMEIGGKVTLTCAATEYHAVLEFHQKPFYGGRKHRFTAELFGPKQKRPFMKLDGEWNNVIYSKVHGEEQSVFFDAQNNPVYKKKIKKFESMEPNESRRVWCHVTSALKEGNEQAAGDAKHEVEEAQREKAKIRKEEGTEWKPKHFKLLEDGRWVYENTLLKRNPALKK